MRKSEIGLMIEELQALLQYEAVLKDKKDSKSMVSFKRLNQRMEEWGKIISEYEDLKKEILEKIQELRKLLMKKIDMFEDYYRKYGCEA
jgi:malate synthase